MQQTRFDVATAALSILIQVHYHSAGGHPIGLFAGSASTRCKLRKRTQKNSALGLVGPLDARILKKHRLLSATGFLEIPLFDFFCGKICRQNPQEVVNKCLWRKRTAIGAFGSLECAL